MKEKLITIAVHTPGKADILRQVLEQRGIQVYFEEVVNNNTLSSFPNSIAVRIKENDLTHALTIIEENNVLSYANNETFKIDDGRKRILVAVDFSSYSMHACQLAFNIAKEINAKVKIMHVFYRLQYPTSLPFAYALKDKDEPDILDKVRKQMLDLCFEIESKITNGEFPSVNYSYTIREGIVEDEIENFIDEYKPVLLVIGIKGKGNDESSVLGNVTADIIETTNIPVLAVPESSPISNPIQIKHLAFLTNLQQRDVFSFNTLADLVKPFKKVKITLLHINILNRKGDKWSDTELASMKEYFISQHPDMDIEYKLVDTPDLVDGVSNFIEEEDVTIIALNTRKRNLFGRIFAPSLTRKMLFRIDVALLVLRG